MEFNPDGSLKLSTPAKKKEVRASITTNDLPNTEHGKHMLVVLHDSTLPYNLIEGHFHEVNTKDTSECDATLAKKSDAEYDIVVSGVGFKKWLDSFTTQLGDYLDGRLEIIEE